MKILRATWADLTRHLESGYPQERCGVLLGREDVVTEVARADNERHDSPHNRYLIHPRAYAGIERDADARALQVVGIYHSHPDAPARPSAFDRTEAWPVLAYLIVPVPNGRTGAARCWRLRLDGMFDEEPVEIIDRPTTMAR